MEERGISEEVDDPYESEDSDEQIEANNAAGLINLGNIVENPFENKSNHRLTYAYQQIGMKLSGDD